MTKTKQCKMYSTQLLFAVKRGEMSKEHAMDLYKSYLERVFNREIHREFPYKRVA